MNRQQRRADKKRDKPAPLRSPSPAQALFNEAIGFHQSGQLGRAEQLYKEVLRLDPRHFDALHLLGLIARHAGQLDAAEALIRRAIAENGRDASFHSNLGNILQELGKIQEAEAAFAQAIKLAPDFAPAHFNLSNLLRHQGKLAAAATHLGKALSLEPENPDARSNLGLIYRDLGRLREAEEQLDLALVHRPDFAQAHCNMGLVRLGAGDIDRAVASFRAALVCLPSLAEAHNGLGSALKKQDRVGQAVTAFARATSAIPSYAEAHSNLGLALKEQARLDDAIGSFDRALGVRPDLAEARFARGLALLQKGDWRRAWDDYEFRWLQNGQTVRMRSYPQPLWRGDAAQGRTLLLWSEQAFGDCIQFARFAPELARRGWRVILETRPELRRLLQGLEGVTVIAEGEPVPEFDVHYPLLSVPRLLGITPETLPPVSLGLPDAAVAAGQALLGDPAGLRIGINWRGRATNQRERWRAASAELFATFLGTPGIEIVSLQKEATPEELAALGPNVRDLSANLSDFADTAGIVANLDLVITVDTAMAHLAGAVNTRTWVLLDFASDWQWLRDRRDSPWYPSVTLFRQPRPGDWQSVAAAIGAELAARL